MSQTKICSSCHQGELRPFLLSANQAIVRCSNPDCDGYLDDLPKFSFISNNGATNNTNPFNTFRKSSITKKFFNLNIIAPTLCIGPIIPKQESKPIQAVPQPIDIYDDVDNFLDSLVDNSQTKPATPSKLVPSHQSAFSEFTPHNTTATSAVPSSSSAIDYSLRDLSFTRRSGEEIHSNKSKPWLAKKYQPTISGIILEAVERRVNSPRHPTAMLDENAFLSPAGSVVSEDSGYNDEVASAVSVSEAGVRSGSTNTKTTSSSLCSGMVSSNPILTAPMSTSYLALSSSSTQCSSSISSPSTANSSLDSACLPLVVPNNISIIPSAINTIQAPDVNLNYGQSCSSTDLTNTVQSAPLQQFNPKLSMTNLFVILEQNLNVQSLDCKNAPDDHLAPQENVSRSSLSVSNAAPDLQLIPSDPVSGPEVPTSDNHCTRPPTPMSEQRLPTLSDHVTNIDSEVPISIVNPSTSLDTAEQVLPTLSDQITIISEPEVLPLIPSSNNNCSLSSPSIDLPGNSLPASSDPITLSSSISKPKKLGTAKHNLPQPKYKKKSPTKNTDDSLENTCQNTNNKRKQPDNETSNTNVQKKVRRCISVKVINPTPGVRKSVRNLAQPIESKPLEEHSIEQPKVMPRIIRPNLAALLPPLLNSLQQQHKNSCPGGRAAKRTKTAHPYRQLASNANVDPWAFPGILLDQLDIQVVVRGKLRNTPAPQNEEKEEKCQTIVVRLVTSNDDEDQLDKPIVENNFVIDHTKQRNNSPNENILETRLDEQISAQSSSLRNYQIPGNNSAISNQNSITQSHISDRSISKTVSYSNNTTNSIGNVSFATTLTSMTSVKSSSSHGVCRVSSTFCQATIARTLPGTGVPKVAASPVVLPLGVTYALPAIGTNVTAPPIAAVAPLDRRLHSEHLPNDYDINMRQDNFTDVLNNNGIMPMEHTGYLQEGTKCISKTAPSTRPSNNIHQTLLKQHNPNLSKLQKLVNTHIPPKTSKTSTNSKSRKPRASQSIPPTFTLRNVASPLPINQVQNSSYSQYRIVHSTNAPAPVSFQNSQQPLVLQSTMQPHMQSQPLLHIPSGQAELIQQSMTRVILPTGQILHLTGGQPTQMPLPNHPSQPFDSGIMDHCAQQMLLPQQLQMVIPENPNTLSQQHVYAQSQEQPLLTHHMQQMPSQILMPVSNPPPPAGPMIMGNPNTVQSWPNISHYPQQPTQLLHQGQLLQPFQSQQAQPPVFCQAGPRSHSRVSLSSDISNGVSASVSASRSSATSADCSSGNIANIDVEMTTPSANTACVGQLTNSQTSPCSPSMSSQQAARLNTDSTILSDLSTRTVSITERAIVTSNVKLDQHRPIALKLFSTSTIINSVNGTNFDSLPKPKSSTFEKMQINASLSKDLDANFESTNICSTSTWTIPISTNLIPTALLQDKIYISSTTNGDDVGSNTEVVHDEQSIVPMNWKNHNEGSVPSVNEDSITSCSALCSPLVSCTSVVPIDSEPPTPDSSPSSPKNFPYVGMSPPESDAGNSNTETRSIETSSCVPSSNIALLSTDKVSKVSTIEITNCNLAETSTINGDNKINPLVSFGSRSSCHSTGSIDYSQYSSRPRVAWSRLPSNMILSSQTAQICTPPPYDNNRCEPLKQSLSMADGQLIPLELAIEHILNEPDSMLLNMNSCESSSLNLCPENVSFININSTQTPYNADDRCMTVNSVTRPILSSNISESLRNKDDTLGPMSPSLLLNTGAFENNLEHSLETGSFIIVQNATEVVTVVPSSRVVFDEKSISLPDSDKKDNTLDISPFMLSESVEEILSSSAKSFVPMKFKPKNNSVHNPKVYNKIKVSKVNKWRVSETCDIDLPADCCRSSDVSLSGGLSPYNDGFTTDPESISTSDDTNSTKLLRAFKYRKTYGTSSLNINSNGLDLKFKSFNPITSVMQSTIVNKNISSASSLRSIRLPEKRCFSSLVNKCLSPSNSPASKSSPPASKSNPPASKSNPPASKSRPPASKFSPPVSKFSPPASKSSPPASTSSPPASKFNPTNDPAQKSNVARTVSFLNLFRCSKKVSNGLIHKDFKSSSKNEIKNSSETECTVSAQLARRLRGLPYANNISSSETENPDVDVTNVENGNHKKSIFRQTAYSLKMKKQMIRSANNKVASADISSKYIPLKKGDKRKYISLYGESELSVSELPDDDAAYEQLCKNGYSSVFKKPKLQIPTGGMFVVPMTEVTAAKRCEESSDEYEDENEGENYAAGQNKKKISSAKARKLKLKAEAREQDVAREKERKVAQEAIDDIVSTRRVEDIPEMVIVNVNGKIFMYGNS